MTTLRSINDSCSAPPPFRGKKGASLPMSDEGQPGSWRQNLPKIILLNPYWNYSWGARLIDAQPDDIEFVPMIWSANNPDQLRKNLDEYVVPHIKSNKIKRLLGFNEPDQKDQANMPVQLALDLWPALEAINLPLVSPGCAQPSGEWMSAFMAAATETNKRVDWVGFHWYGGASFTYFVRHITDFYELHHRPILITEFAPADWAATTVEENRFSKAAVLAFMKEALPWLEAQDWVAGYTWFSFGITSPAGTSSALFDDEDKLTACGRFYASVRADNPKGDQSIAPDS